MNPPESDSTGLLDALRAAGLLHSAHPVARPLPGGVSSEILLVEDGGRRLVVKRALERLRVRDEWHADPGRSRAELAYLRRAGAIVPGCVPRVIYAAPAGDWFAMEYLGPEFTNWKTALLAGQLDPATAAAAGTLLGRIHRDTWRDPSAAREFATLENFRQLRLHPYLLTTAERVPGVAALLRTEVARIEQTALALVHGDFSPKNMLAAAGRLVLLDAEVAVFSDPAFDPAFLVSHLCLKAVHHPARTAGFGQLARIFWSRYRAALGTVDDPGLEVRVVRLTLCLLLARVHGKSPVEYLSAPQQAFVSSNAAAALHDPPSSLDAFLTRWKDALVHADPIH